MCTVSYLPKQGKEFILTHNRDETPLRKSLLPEVHSNGLWHPTDAEAGGTWIAASNQPKILCVLNGAFERHKRQLPYRKSRGRVALEFFEYPDTATFVSQYDFHNIEPFTLIIIQNNQLFDFRWDGQDPHLKELDARQPHIWSSVPLYDQNMRDLRQLWFNDWLEVHKDYQPDDILAFHKTAGDGDPFTDVLMNRLNLVQTVSISNIFRIHNELHFRYFDVLSERETFNQLPIV